jgi:glycosyltransferase involved in cell wall biosynthesis
LKNTIVAIDARLAGGASTGDSTYWNGLLWGLDRVDHGFRLLLFSNAARPAGVPMPSGAEWIRARGSSRWWSLVGFPLAARRLRARAIHTQYNLSPLAGSRGLTTIHDVSFFIGPEWFRPVDRELLRRFVPASARRAAAVITVSETSRSEIERFIPAARGKVRVTPLAARPDLVPVPRPEAVVRVERRGIKVPYLLTIGTRWPRKNMALAIEATRGLGLPLVITGKPGWGDEPPGDHILALGYVNDDELSDLYSAAELALVPSRHEGFGLVAVEAFACGCPVLVSAGGALPETVGTAGAVEPSWDPAVWRTRISELLADSSTLERMRVEGRRRAADFDWRETARLTTAAYREVAS